jgi:hypothetical protein
MAQHLDESLRRWRVSIVSTWRPETIQQEPARKGHFSFFIGFRRFVASQQKEISINTF